MFVCEGPRNRADGRRRRHDDTWWPASTCRMAGAGSVRGVPALSKLRHRSRSTGKRCGRQYTPASAASGCAYGSRTPTGRATWSSARRTSRSAPEVSAILRPDRPSAQVQRIAHDHHPRRSARGQRCRDARRARARRHCGQSLSPGECRCDDPARGGPANELHLDARRLHRRDRLCGSHDAIVLLPHRCRSPRLGRGARDSDPR